MIYELSHTTTYNYSDTVSLSHHLLRLQPRELTRQHCQDVDLKVDPAPGSLRTQTDYFGNQLTFVTVKGAHKRLTVAATSRVEVLATPPPSVEASPAWSLVRQQMLDQDPELAMEAGEFLYDSPQISLIPAFQEYAQASFPAGRPVLAAALDLTNRIYRDFKFDPKATTVATPLTEVLKHRRGVCQDFAHLEIAFLRSMGIPARYVSGYLETDPPPGKARLAGADASHAWLAFFCPGTGWIDLDPTNNLIPTNRHITLAWGRDYGDVSPIRGVILGSGEHSLKVAVDVIPADEPRFRF